MSHCWQNPRTWPVMGSQGHCLLVGTKCFGIPAFYLFPFLFHFPISSKREGDSEFLHIHQGNSSWCCIARACSWEYLYPFTSCISFPSAFPLWPLLCHILFWCPNFHFLKLFQAFAIYCISSSRLCECCQPRWQSPGTGSIPMKTSSLLGSRFSSILGILLPAPWRTGVLTVTSELLCGILQSTCWISARWNLLVGGGSCRKSGCH